MKKDYSITRYFGSNLAQILSQKIIRVYPDFKSREYIKTITKQCEGKSYTQRVELHADTLKKYLPKSYKKTLAILLKTLGEENKNETGMFKIFYWILPIGKFVEKYGLDNYNESIHAIEEITKRNTGEYAIRPFIRTYPDKTLSIMKNWSKSDNFHLRRLASEGLRPKLPWATKLDEFIKNPDPVFNILENLKEDNIKFVQKSVANHLTDYLKVNPEPTKKLLRMWKKSKNKNTEWIIKRATRKIKV
jgi:3-methyladenine DNA glycosylase AlkC